MAKLSPLMIAPPLIFAGFAMLAFVGMFRDDPEGLPSTRIGQPAPAITLEVLGDFPGVTPDMLKTGEVTLVNFWASWCPPCRAEHPRLLQMQADGMQIIGVNFKDQAGDALSYLADESSPFKAIAFDPKGRTAIEWGVTAPPETFILDGEGVVLFRFAGPLVGSDYEQRFVPALEAALAK
ncbi:DsbE family thiol:disulfide interchange protein [Puniceibacterium sediminis]|uniref:Cytochrome c biogenesis protein CcmG, thiol:disulfide interchange protein DsbE n=1 Tax=Puniceibacterium sediminis TaxID=1608407 RepID=A0A238UYM5_9RHOB|nr:DsbE family thiol:disulfide interchange protein [Puniceibacterium sediminis]SNR27116.1 cytochrome c biogenesis protein CcmG, thiol:disulfide interchange protein DsbE [Puniceibacterium sediminis]